MAEYVNFFEIFALLLGLANAILLIQISLLNLNKFVKFIFLFICALPSIISILAIIPMFITAFILQKTMREFNKFYFVLSFIVVVVFGVFIFLGLNQMGH